MPFFMAQSDASTRASMDMSNKSETRGNALPVAFIFFIVP